MREGEAKCRKGSALSKKTCLFGSIARFKTVRRIITSSSCRSSLCSSLGRLASPAAPKQGRCNQKGKTVHRLAENLFLLFCLLCSGSVLANDVEEKFLAAGLVDLASIDRTIQVDLVNSDPEKNFFRKNFYGGLNKAYLRKGVAKKLSYAQRLLKKEKPSFSLQVLDAARPRSVSRSMYETMKGTRFEKYVANPDKGSMHNYGIAVDLTIVDGNGEKLDMGPSPFYKSHAAIYWQYFLKKMGVEISQEQKRNRELLKRVMLNAGFYPLSFEWWHFNGMKKADARNTYPIIE